jgi:hypothetical protein
MPRYSRKTQYKESSYAADLVKIMKAGQGPFTRTMLAEGLSLKYPDLAWQELMNEISSAIQMDRLAKKNRFRLVRHGWYDLPNE